MPCSSAPSEPNCCGAAGPTSRAKPGTGLGSRRSRSVASRKLIKAWRRSATSAWRNHSEKLRPDSRRSMVKNRLVSLTDLDDHRHLDTDVDVLPGLIERAELIGGLLRRLVAGPVQPEHPFVVECEDLALATGPEQLIRTDAERGQHGTLPGIIIKIIHRSLLAGRLPGGAGPIQLAERQLPGGPNVQLLGDRVDQALRRIEVHVGQSQAPLQRTLLDANRLRLGVRHHVAYPTQPAMLGDHDLVVPAVAQGPEIQPAQPSGPSRRGMQLDLVKIDSG